MALLGAALAPVIHCSNWANRSIYFCLLIKAASTRLIGQTDNAAFSYREKSAVPPCLAGDVLANANCLMPVR
jgi:hypothetical protein